LTDLQFKSEHLINHNLKPKKEALPYFRFQRALEEKRSLFREFRVRPPYQSAKDIFCLRIERTIDSYRKISVNNLQLKVSNSLVHSKAR